MNKVDDKYIDYANKVISGQIIAGEAIKLTCKRYLSWFDRKDIYFDEQAAEKPVKFIHKLKHWEGKQFRGKPFELQDWQQFMIYNLFGWKRKKDDRRLIRRAYIQISRKNGKTSLASALGLYALIADGEAGAEVDIVAPSAEQSRIGFRNASNYAETINKHDILKIQRGLINFPHTKSRFRIMSSDAKFGDGFNPSLAIIDEYHAFKNNDIPMLLASGMGMREQPMLIYITTAGLDLYSPCKEYRDMCIEVLRGLKTDDSLFPLIYELDEDDDWENNKVWKKCCPSLNNTVFEDYMFGEMQHAKNNPIDLTDVKTKTFNMWCASQYNWISDDLIKKHSKKFNLEQFATKDEKTGEYLRNSKYYCYCGIDLAADSDFTSLTVLIPDENKLYFKTYLFVPKDTLGETKNEQLYRKWSKTGDLIVTPGNVQDYDFIINKLMEINKMIMIKRIAYDKWNATSFAVNAQYKGLPMIPYSQALGNFTIPTSEFARRLKEGNVIIDNNEAVRWCFSNCAIKEDHNQNKKPVKSGKRDQKIDAVISILESFGIMLDDPYCAANILLKN